MSKLTLALIFLFGFLPLAQAEECEYVCEYVCQESEAVSYDYSKTVIINEVYPSPLDGQDEFIELYNTGSKKVDLAGWYLTDASGKKHSLTGEIDDYLVLYQADSKIYLNNTGDEVSLYQPDDVLLDSVVYDAEGEAGWSYARSESEWLWTTVSTPSQVNQIVPVAEEPEEEEPTEDDETAPEEEDEEEEIAEDSEIQEIKIIRELEKGAQVLVQGVVTAVPDTLSSQIFYLEDSTAGIQVYSSQKTFPSLNLGDLVQVTGELSEAYSEKRINIKSVEQAQIVGTAEVSIGEIQSLGEELEGQLVSTTSQIAQKDGSKLYLTNEVLVYKKSAVDLSFSDLSEGDEITVIGIVSQYQDEYRLLPRSSEDLVINEKYQASATSSANSLIKTARAATKNESVWSLPDTPEQKNVLYILLGAMAFLLIALAAVSWKRIVDYVEKLRKVRNTD